MSKSRSKQPSRGSGCVADNLNIVPSVQREVFTRHLREHVPRTGQGAWPGMDFWEKRHFLSSVISGRILKLSVLQFFHFKVRKINTQGHFKDQKSLYM